MNPERWPEVEAIYQALPSTAFKYVLVGDVAILDGGRLVDAVHPGRALTGR